MRIFKNRQSAGQLLAKRLKSTKADLVLGIPRGGVVVASAVAASLKLPLDIIVTRKIGALTQPELALGAVDPDGEVVWDEELLEQLKIDNGQLTMEINNETQETKRRENIYRRGKRPLDVGGKTIILVDDGVATGSTTLSAINYLRRHGAEKIILAVPVASREAMDRIVRELGPAPDGAGFGEVVILESPENFQAVGQFYQHFDPVSDEEVVQLLRS